MSERDRKLLESLKTTEELKKRGLRQVTCHKCHGLGHILIGERHSVCFTCDGQGYKWQGEIRLRQSIPGLWEFP